MKVDIEFGWQACAILTSLSLEVAFYEQDTVTHALSMIDLFVLSMSKPSVCIAVDKHPMEEVKN